MFYFQCQETAKRSGCTAKGVCGKVVGVLVDKFDIKPTGNGQEDVAAMMAGNQPEMKKTFSII